MIILNNLLLIHLKLLQKEQFKKQQKQLIILIGNKIADKITNVSKSSLQNISETVEGIGLNREVTKQKQKKQHIYLSNKDRKLLIK